MSLFLDTDLNVGTGCSGLLGHGPDFGMVFPRFGTSVNAIRGTNFCTFTNISSAVCIAARGFFVELAVPIESLRMVSPNTTGFSLSALTNTASTNADFILASEEYLLK